MEKKLFGETVQAYNYTWVEWLAAWGQDEAVDMHKCFLWFLWLAN